MHVAFVFVDGVGLGPAGPANPLSTLTLPYFKALAKGQQWTDEAHPVVVSDHVFKPIDATLGVEGLPQSGTGQTALFTGRNAARVAGRHYGPFPHSATHHLLEEHSLFVALPRALRAFANAYPDRFFSYSEATNRWSTTTRMCRAAGVPLRTGSDVAEGRALAADITGAGWPEPGVVEALSARAAGARFHAIARAHTITLFEYYLTDKAGHGRGTRTAASVLTDLDTFLGGYLGAFDPTRDLLLLTSDHGNLEALDTKSHTRNPVPLVVLGRGAERFAGATSLLDVTPALVDLLNS